MRAHMRCEYCRSPEEFSLDSFTIDHIEPVTHAGNDTLENLAFSCHNCNNRKQDDRSAVDPQTGEQAPFYNPRQDLWSDHFRWSEDFHYRARDGNWQSERRTPAVEPHGRRQHPAGSSGHGRRASANRWG